jgi:hypothetical protein
MLVKVSKHTQTLQAASEGVCVCVYVCVCVCVCVFYNTQIKSPQVSIRCS